MKLFLNGVCGVLHKRGFRDGKNRSDSHFPSEEPQKQSLSWVATPIEAGVLGLVEWLALARPNNPETVAALTIYEIWPSQCTHAVD
jgi:hypothetical protein